MDLMSDEFEKTILGKTHNRFNNYKVKPQHINLIALSHKQFNHLYNKHLTLRSSCKSCSPLRLGILPSLGLEIHNQPALCELPWISTNASPQHSLDLGFFPRQDLGFTLNQHHTNYLGFSPASNIKNT